MAATSKTIRDFRTEVAGKIVDGVYVAEIPNYTAENGKEMYYRFEIMLRHADKGVIPIEDCHYNNPLDPKIHAEINTHCGCVGGKERPVIPTVVTKGKHQGKKNETNAFTQALRDVEGKFDKKKHNVAPDDATHPRPMLAKTGTDKIFEPKLAGKKKVTAKDAKGTDNTKGKEKGEIEAEPTELSLHVTKKLDGHRAVMYLNNDGNVEFYSRTGRNYPDVNLTHLAKELKPVLKIYKDDGINLYLDGEFYIHGMSLQKIHSMITADKAATKDIPKMQLVLFDCFIVDDDMKLKPKENKLENRQEILDEIFANAKHFKYVSQAEVFYIKNKEEFDRLSNTTLAEGYEGLIVRVANSDYKFSNNNYRGNNLLKFKPFEDAEFEVVGFREGEGKYVGMPVLTCVRPACVYDGKQLPAKEFDVNPKMDEDEKRKLFQDLQANFETPAADGKPKYKGRKYTVRFNSRSEDYMPLCNRGIAFRDLDGFET